MSCAFLFWIIHNCKSKYETLFPMRTLLARQWERSVYLIKIADKWSVTKQWVAHFRPITVKRSKGADSQDTQLQTPRRVFLIFICSCVRHSSQLLTLIVHQNTATNSHWSTQTPLQLDLNSFCLKFGLVFADVNRNVREITSQIWTE